MLLWNVVLYFLIMLPNLSIYTFCDTEVIYLQCLFFKVLINLSATKILLNYALNTFLYYLFLAIISMICYAICCLYQPIFYFVLCLDSFKMFWKSSLIVRTFLYFKGKTQAFLLTTSITHNKKRISLLNWLNNSIATTSEPHILSIKDERTSVFQIF